MNKTVMKTVMALIAIGLAQLLRAQTTEVMVVVDLSTSTLGEYQGTSFQEMELLFVEQFTNGLDNSAKCGFSAFAGQWSNACPPAAGRIQTKGMLSLLRAEKDCTKTGRMEDGTAIYSALLHASTALGGQANPRSILLLTDGSDNRSNISASLITQWLQDRKIRVDVVGFSCLGNVDYPMMTGDSVKYIQMPSNQDYQEVTRIAEATNGVFVRVTQKGDIAKAVQQILESIRRGAIPTTPPPTGYIHERMKRWLQDRIAKEEIQLF